MLQVIRERLSADDDKRQSADGGRARGGAEAV
jgi:hypothetical protein